MDLVVCCYYCHQVYLTGIFFPTITPGPSKAFQRRCTIFSRPDALPVTKPTASKTVQEKETDLMIDTCMIITRARLCIARSLPSKDVCLSVCHTPVLCANGQIYLKTFSTTW